mmetsp:Transcript_20984/g.41142  ORF Transcript_20984/g.41142 Transcript_20984/m.41142 type:complete len:769 (+) Transcript_20984:449-2755(+)|eukprot:CAMPEP_0171587364 /NCGR_PEP_ID=MMETSP0961-20121227/13264_1 /TAXON_ID=87120 /ORGANISM="Aurantiochytrium limacinum, Strain ATCCMYA-1381" /LENGTH=768 /DNA_ID=CAMNT_0012145567 /DNA_START=350 /DNA_END=2656 /DNA_ORIENTATION=-
MKRVSQLRKSVKRAVQRTLSDSVLSRGGNSLSQEEEEKDAALEDVGDDALATFRGVSLASLEDLYSRIRDGSEAEGIELGECLRASRKRKLKRGQSVRILRREGNMLVCTSPFRFEPTFMKNRRASTPVPEGEYELELGREVRTKSRREWTMEDVCQFVVLPAMRERRGGVYAKEVLENGQAVLGEPFEGAYLAVPRATKFATLLSALRYHYAACHKEKTFIWLDILCANQVRASENDYGEAGCNEEAAMTKELLRRTKVALGKFRDRLLFFKSWLDPVPLSRSWCIFEVLAGMESKKPFHIVTVAEEEDRFAAALQHNPQMVVSIAQTWYDVMSSRCRNIHDRSVLEEALDQGYGNLKAANTTFNACIRQWLAESALKAVDTKRSGLEPGSAIAWFGALLHRAGQLLFAAEDFAQARAFYQEALDVLRKELGSRNARVARLLSDLASCQQRLGFATEALDLAQEALPLFKSKFGNTAETATLLRILAEVTMEVGGDSAVEQATAYYEQAIDIYREIYGEDSPRLAVALNNAAHVLLQAGDFNMAISYCEEALSIRETQLGKTHPKLASTHSNLGEIYRVQSMFDKAQQQYDQAIEIYFEQIYSNHEDAKDVFHEVLEALAIPSGQENHKKALKTIEEARHKSVSRAMKEINPQVVRLLVQKADVLISGETPEVERALMHLTVAAAFAQQIHGPNSLELSNILETSAAVFGDAGNYKMSIELSKQVLTIRSKALPKNDPNIISSKAMLRSYERRRSEGLLSKDPPACT